MDYQAGIYTVINTVTGSNKEYRITDQRFKLPGDNMVIVTDDLINKIREELKC
jgi:signal peptidase I